MKKGFKLLTSIIYGSCLFAITSCSLGLIDYEVDSVTLKDSDGNEYVIDKSLDFFDVAYFTDNALNKDTFMVEVDSTLKTENQKSQIVKGNVYRYQTDTIYYDLKIKSDVGGESSFQFYYCIKEGTHIEYIKLQNGSQLYVIGSENGHVFENEKYLSMNAELDEHYYFYDTFRSMMMDVKPYDLFPRFIYSSKEEGRVDFDFEKLTQRSFTIYNTSIVFTQESPIIYGLSGPGDLLYSVYSSSIKNKYKITKTMRYNYLSDSIEYIKYSGNVVCPFIVFEWFPLRKYPSGRRCRSGQPESAACRWER